MNWLILSAARSFSAAVNVFVAFTASIHFKFLCTTFISATLFSSIRLLLLLLLLFCFVFDRDVFSGCLHSGLTNKSQHTLSHVQQNGLFLRIYCILEYISNVLCNAIVIL